MASSSGVAREHHDLDGRLLGADLPGGLDAGAIRQPDVHHDAVGPEPAGGRHGLRDGPRLRHHLEPGPPLEQGHDALPHHRMVVHHQESQRWGPRRGREGHLRPHGIRPVRMVRDHRAAGQQDRAGGRELRMEGVVLLPHEVDQGVPVAQPRVRVEPVPGVDHAPVGGPGHHVRVHLADQRRPGCADRRVAPEGGGASRVAARQRVGADLLVAGDPPRRPQRRVLEPDLPVQLVGREEAHVRAPRDQALERLAHAPRPVLVMALEDHQPTTGEDLGVAHEIDVGGVLDVAALALEPADELELPVEEEARALVEHIRAIEAHLRRLHGAPGHRQARGVVRVKALAAPAVVGLPGGRRVHHQHGGPLCGVGFGGRRTTKGTYPTSP